MSLPVRCTSLYSLAGHSSSTANCNNLLLRVGFEARQAFREFYVNPLQPTGGTAQLLLLNSGRRNYREFLRMLRWRVNERSTVFASYVHPRARGELNDYNRVPRELLLPPSSRQPARPLASDAPNRGQFWSVIGLSQKLDLVPILDVHTGFPFSRIDQNWNFLGAENEAKRLPTFLVLDTKLQYPIDFTFAVIASSFAPASPSITCSTTSIPATFSSTMHHRTTAPSTNSIGRLFRIRWRLQLLSFPDLN